MQSAFLFLKRRAEFFSIETILRIGIDGVLEVYIMRTSLQRSGFGGARREKLVVEFERR